MYKLLSKSPVLEGWHLILPGIDIGGTHIYLQQDRSRPSYGVFACFRASRDTRGIIGR